MKELDAVFRAEKKSIQEKVAIELESTLKAAVRERMETKKQLEDLGSSKDSLQKEYDELREMYEMVKASQKEAEALTKQSEVMIKELEQENASLKGEKQVVSEANIGKSGAMEAAVKQYDEMKAAFVKLDEARYSLNKVMGPGGSMTETERKLYLSNLPDADKYVGAANHGTRALPASSLPPMGGQRSSLQMGGGLQNNPSRAYFNQAGIGGSSLASAQYNPPMDEQRQDDDDFWYQGGGAGAGGDDFGGGNRLYG